MCDTGNIGAGHNKGGEYSISKHRRMDGVRTDVMLNGQHKQRNIRFRKSSAIAENFISTI
jgi:hypothetical protein